MMRKASVGFVLGFIVFGIYSCTAQEKAVELKSEKDKVSYSIGWDIGSNFKRQGIEIESVVLAEGLKNAISGDKGLMSEQEMQETLGEFQNKMRTKQTAERQKSGDENKKKGEEFLKKNKANKGVVVLPSGLQYKVIEAGKGKKPSSTDVVKVHYQGTLIDGTEFDSSYKRGTPATFPLNGVIKGWTEGLSLMTVGSKWELYIPSNLAYGDQGAGGSIPPASALIFTVELLSIEEKK